MVVISIACPLLITGITLFFVYKMFSGMRQGQQDRNEILTTGAPAQAQIEQVSMALQPGSTVPVCVDPA